MAGCSSTTANRASKKANMRRTAGIRRARCCRSRSELRESSFFSRRRCLSTHTHTDRERREREREIDDSNWAGGCRQPAVIAFSKVSFEIDRLPCWLFPPFVVSLFFSFRPTPMPRYSSNTRGRAFYWHGREISIIHGPSSSSSSSSSYTTSRSLPANKIDNLIEFLCFFPTGTLFLFFIFFTLYGELNIYLILPPPFFSPLNMLHNIKWLIKFRFV